ncbi:MAG: ABC transporter ATP-binding protein [Methanosarcinales archaeon]|nr:ABC transporter ATP-binding protein [Methanosarcinales archaeon]
MKDHSYPVKARGICKGFSTLFSRKEVLLDVSLEVEEGEIFGIIGPNGSGKTTLLSIFSTLIFPDRGDLCILGLNARKETHAVRGLINISTGKPNFPWSLTVWENLLHFGMLYGLHGSQLHGAVEEVMDSFQLQEYRDSRFESLSTGLKQRLSLAKSMINHPRLLFLDEPTTGLDPEMAIKTRSLVRKIHREGVSVIVTTHYMPEAEQLCDRVAFLKEGRIAALDTPGNLKRSLKLGERIVIQYRGELDREALRTVPGVLCAEFRDGRAELVVDKSQENMSRVMRLFAGTEILDMAIEEPDLEDVYLELAR